MSEIDNEKIELLNRETGNEGYDYDEDDYEETTHFIELENKTDTPKTSTGRESLRPKIFKGKETKWGEVKTPQLKIYIGNAWKKVEENFPNLDRSKRDEIRVNINDSDEITVKFGIRSNAVSHTLFDDNGDMNESIPKTIKDILGKQISAKGLRDKLSTDKSKKKLSKKKLKENEDLIKKQNDEKKNNDAKLREQMNDRDMEESKKEIDKLTNKLNLEKEKKIKDEKSLEELQKNLVELQKKNTSLENQRFKTKQDMEVNEKSSDNFKKSYSEKIKIY